MKNPFVRLVIVILVIVGLVALIRVAFKGQDTESMVITKNGILQLQLDNVIINGKRFLKNLKKYRENPNIKAILVVIDSPGGTVGPSQEIYSELMRTREEFKLPVVCVSNGLVASGAYYSAAGCEKLVVAPGALVGSIGVIMGFANLEGLYGWAKINRFSITSGKYKDSGAEYRAMRDDEKKLFQDLIDEVYQQFRGAIAKARNLKDDVLDQYADGRVFTGAKAVEIGFADQVGTFHDAANLAAELAGLPADYEIFEVPKRRRSIWDLGAGDEEDNVNSFESKKGLFSKSISAKEVMDEVLRTQWLNKPVLLMPGYWQ